MTIKLIQFPISHFCEKVRWALDYKGIPYQVENAVPGFHMLQVRRVASKATVPVIVQDKTVVQGSGDIITWLDQHYPQPLLTPSDPGLAGDALEWETYLDKEIGVHIRRYVYQTLLQYPKKVIPLLGSDGNWWVKPYLTLGYPGIAKFMRTGMNITPETAAKSKERVLAALKRVNDALQGGEFLVGNQFTRADLTAGALAAPLFTPDEYGIDWPQDWPEPLQTELEEFEPYLKSIKAVYTNYRHKS